MSAKNMKIIHILDAEMINFIYIFDVLSLKNSPGAVNFSEMSKLTLLCISTPLK